jgi:hypothetical protein
MSEGYQVNDIANDNVNDVVNRIEQYNLVLNYPGSTKVSFQTQIYDGFTIFDYSRIKVLSLQRTYVRI